MRARRGRMDGMNKAPATPTTDAQSAPPAPAGDDRGLLLADARLLLDAEGRVIAANAAAARLLDQPAEALCGLTLYDALGEPPDAAFVAECAWASRERCRVAFEARAPHLGLWLELQAEPHDAGGLQLRLRDVSARRQGSDALRLNAERFHYLARALADAVWDWDLVSDRVWWSDEAQALLGCDATSWRVHGRAWLERVHPDDRPRVARHFEAALAGPHEAWSDEFRLLRMDGGRALPVSCRGFLIRDAQGQVLRMVGGLRDASQNLAAQRELARLSRAQRMLSACNDSLIRAESEVSLLRGVCRMAVEIGGYAMAWVGYAHEDTDRSIEVVAHAGNDAAYMQGIPMSWSELGPNGMGPAARSIRSGEVVIVEDIAEDPSFAPWLAEAQASGFHGVACLPLRDKHRTFGLFYLYAPEVVQIGAHEVALLQELANNLAFGIDNLRAQRQQNLLQAAVRQVAMAVSADTGDAFFTQLAQHMEQAVGARATFIARVGPGATPMARVIASVVDGRPGPLIETPMVGTPSEPLLHAPSCVTVDLPEPSPSMLRALGGFRPGAYVGLRLDNASGRLVGVVVALFASLPTRVDVVLSTLQIFAARAASEIERQDNDRRLRRQASLLDLAQDAIVVHDVGQRVRYWNKSAARLYGWDADEVRGDFRVTRLYPEPQAFEQALAAVRAQGEWHGEMLQLRRDGSTLTVEGRWSLVRDEQGQPEAILSIHTDISARKQAEREIQQLAFYDPLTQLPNRVLLTDRLQHALVVAQRGGRGGALLFIDLDNFKTLNDTLGHDMGDLLLLQVAVRLRACVRESDTVARLGGDEFVVMLEDLGANDQDAAMLAKAVGEKILAALSPPYQLAGNEHLSTSSIGIAPFQHGTGSVGELLKQADIAMYQAKAAGRNTLRFFDPALQAAVSARAALEADLRTALAQNALTLFYQPQIDAAGQITGVEALVRWHHPLRGLITPADFIPLAEETGLILQLGRWVLREACHQLQRWATQPGRGHLGMAVNVSSRQFRHPDFVAHVGSVLARTKADARKLKLELTESLLVEDIAGTAAKMAAIKAHGAGFSLDDFGTGYSSLAYLRRLPLDQLKIDQTFVRDLVDDPNAQAIVRTIIGLAASLGLDVIAEGVETEAQRELLARAGCRAYQGYLFSKPLPIDALESFFDAHLPAQPRSTSTRQS